MNPSAAGRGEKPPIPEKMRHKWRKGLEAIVRAQDLQAAIIHRLHPPDLDLFLSESAGEKDAGEDRTEPDIRLLCEKVASQRAPVFVGGGMRDPRQSGNPASGMAFYLGLPLVWPDGDLFGTICAFALKNHPRALQSRGLIAAFKESIEDDLRLLLIIEKQTSEMRENKEIMDERLRFDDFAAELSAAFVDLAPERVDEGIAFALERSCRFFGADHCGLLDVLPNRRTTRYLYKHGPSKTLPKALRISSHPWAYQRLVGKGEPLVLSSLEELPAEAGADRLSWEKDGVAALAMIPLLSKGNVTHLIALYGNHAGAKWSVTPLRRFRHLAAVFSKTLIHKQDRESLLRSEALLAEAEGIAHLGSWTFNIADGTYQWSDELYRIFGLSPRAVAATYDAFLAFVHPEDRLAVRQANQKAILNPEKAHAIDYRVVRPDGSQRTVHSRTIFFSERGKDPVRMVGVVHDVTEQRQAEESQERALAQIMVLKEKAERENITLQQEQFRERIPGVIGDSKAIRYIMHRIQKVAATKTTVLFLGETGTGKGYFADALYKAGDRREKPFVVVNCAGLPPNLIESELFGREKGAFTGSTARQIGRFELANGGTIFLDEIGELPLELQAKLLKVIEDEVFERLGSPHPVKVDVRIIASTNRNLEEEIRKGQFRKDLYYRLNVFPMTIPPLKQRKEDIAPLAEYFLAGFSGKLGKRVTTIPRKTLLILENHPWPGNVRELSNVIERSVIMSKGPELELVDLPDPSSVPPESSDAPAAPESSANKSLLEVERDHIIKTLQETGWKISGADGAAQHLGLHSNTLRARMQKLGVKRPRIH